MLWLVSLLFLALPTIALAQAFVPLAGIPGLTQGVTADQAGLANFFNNLYKYLIGLAAVLAVIEIIWGGLLISTQDSISKKGEGKEKIQNAIFGLVLVLSPVLVFSIINPSILNLSLNLPKLGTTSAPAAQTETCTSNCDTGATSATAGSSAGTSLTLFSCFGADCTGAKKACNDRNTVAAAAGSQNYDPVIVCSLSGALDPNGATSKSGNGDAAACKTGENFVVNCIVTQLAQ